MMTNNKEHMSKVKNVFNLKKIKHVMLNNVTDVPLHNIRDGYDNVINISVNNSIYIKI